MSFILILNIMLAIHCGYSAEIFIFFIHKSLILYKFSFFYIIFILIFLLFSLGLYIYCNRMQNTLLIFLLKSFFYSLNCILLFVLLYIISSHIHILLFNDVLWESSKLLILQEYTLLEKIDFIYWYLDYCLLNSELHIYTKFYIIDLFMKADFIHNESLEEATISDLKALVEEYVDDAEYKMQRRFDTYRLLGITPKH